MTLLLVMAIACYNRCMQTSLPAVLFFSLLFSITARAEFACKSQVSYKWKKVEPPNEELVVDFSVVEAAGADEAAAKAKLNEVTLGEKNKALERCRTEHESVADCLAAKYSSMASVLNTLRFDARKSMEEAIASDCKLRQGICTVAIAGDPQCVEKVAAAGPEGTPAAGGKEAAKDAKGAKKK